MPDIVDLFKVNIDTTIGKILISMALESWSQVYDGAELGQVVTPSARLTMRRIADVCVYDQAQILTVVPSSLVLGLSFISTPPWEVEPWRTIAEENAPGQAPVGVPMLVTQGDADTIVAPDVTARFVSDLCAAGETVEHLVLPGVGHVDAGHAAAQDVAAWIADRFAGEPAPSSCPG